MMQIRLLSYLVQCLTLIAVAAHATATTPNFDLIGYATMNGGTNGGDGGKTVFVSTLSDFQRYARKPEKLVIKIAGKISGGSDGAQVIVQSNKTLLGVGDSAFLEGVGLRINGRKNIIIRNIRFTMSTVTKTHTNDEGRQQVSVNDGDLIHIQDSSYIWIDHCEFYNIDPAIQHNQDLFDGLIDVTHKSEHITVSYCYFHDHHKVSLLGHSDKFQHNTKVTFHHNFFRNVEERLPSVRYGEGHIFNNYYVDVHNSGVNSRMGACLKIEKNQFESVVDPIVKKYSEIPGKWDVNGNLFLNCSNLPTESTCSLHIPYHYDSVLEDAQSVKDTVSTWSGVGKIKIA